MVRFIGMFLLGALFAEVSFADDLRKRDEKRALGAIDRICADTWCEGDYNFQFRKLRCNFTLASCVLSYRIAPWPGQEGEEYDWGQDQNCVIRNISSLDQLISTRGTVSDLNQEPYEQITACIDYQTLKRFY